MSDDLFYDPAVLKVIRAILVRHGIRDPEDLKDAIQDVVLACIEYVHKTGMPPKDAPGAIAIVRRVAGRDVIDLLRRRSSHGTQNAGPTPDADLYAQPQRPALDPVDQRRIRESIEAKLTDEEIETLADLAAGVPHAELAAERGGSPAKSRKQAQRSRGKALRALGPYAAAGGIVALLAGVVGMYFGAFDKPTAPVSGPPPERTVDGGLRPTREIAEELRRIAAEACKAQNWDGCERALDSAAQADPEGEREVEVKEMRKAIAAGRSGMGPGPQRR